MAEIGSSPGGPQTTVAPYMLALGIGRWVVEEQQGPVPMVNYMDPGPD